MSVSKKLNFNLNDFEQKALSENQKQTEETFGFKWKKRDTFESKNVQIETERWLLERYCDGDRTYLEKLLGDEGKIIIDAGCGACHSAILLFKDLLKKHDFLGIDVSDAINVAKDRFNEKGYKGEFLHANLLDLPMIPNESVDMIFSEGVLHHTDSTEDAIKYLSSKLKKGGHFLFYVYKKKAPIREFTDDHIREQLSSLSDNEAWNEMYSLTKLGKVLGDLDLEIEIPEDIPYLGIEKGKINLQRFFYWNICKMYYRPEYTIDEMNHVNFDWFRPKNCHRHTEEEILRFCLESNLEILRFNIQDAGITVVSKKNN
jgi:SAM-dependent methyltransferase